MSEDRPLRNEDYLAISEQNRRLTGENEKLRSQKKPSATPGWASTSIIMLGTFTFFCGVMSQQPVPGDIEPKKPPLVISVERNTECYFTRHTERYNAPWDPYYVLRSPCEHCENQFMAKDGKYVKFPTQIEAWNFIKSWNVPACGMEK